MFRTKKLILCYVNFRWLLKNMFYVFSFCIRWNVKSNDDPFTLPTNQANLAQPICGGPNQLCFLVGNSNDNHFLLYLSSLPLLHIREGTRLETFQFMMPGNTYQRIIWCIEAEETLGSLKNSKEPILLIIDLRCLKEEQ